MFPKPMDARQPIPLSFDHTEQAFAHKSDAELRKAHFLFSSMSKPWLVRLGLWLTPIAIRYRLPFSARLIRRTLFDQFVGGESLEQTAPVAGKLHRHGVQVILDYGVEGEEGEAAFESATDTFLRVIRYAATQPNIPFISIKVTGIARFALLEQLHTSLQRDKAPTLMKRYLNAVEKLEASDRDEWQRVVVRLQRLCDAARQEGTGVLVDAEESWIQDPVDALTMLMMDSFNREKAVVYNTIQLYRHDRLAFLKNCHQAACERGFQLGVKLVRGAYMEKERARAAEKGYPSPIQPDKASSDRDYDQAITYCLEHLSEIFLIVASHNEESHLHTLRSLRTQGLEPGHSRVHFSQLYGMSDNLTFNLVPLGCQVSKYLPFGPIGDVVPYLMRRAQENSSVAGQTGRELALIRKEMKRRGL